MNAKISLKDIKKCTSFHFQNGGRRPSLILTTQQFQHILSKTSKENSKPYTRTLPQANLIVKIRSLVHSIWRRGSHVVKSTEYTVKYK